jgi:hypothetical protein
MTVDVRPWCSGIGRAPHEIGPKLLPFVRGDLTIVCSDCIERAAHGMLPDILPRSAGAAVAQELLDLYDRLGIDRILDDWKRQDKA